MSGHRRISMHRDSNEGAIFDAFKVSGCSVLKINQSGAPDAVVFCPGRTLLVEIKTKAGKFTPAQKRFHAAWQGPEIHIVRTPEEAMQLARG